MRLCGVFAVVLCAAATSFGAISFVGNTLTYSDPADLSTVIDPADAGLNDVTNSYGITKADFQALNPQVVAFNDAGAPTPTRTLVVNNSATGTVTFTFPEIMYNYGAPTTKGRGAFSGSSLGAALSTVGSVDGGLNDWFDATISTSGSQGVAALGFCAAFRNDQNVFDGEALFTLSDGTTEAVDLPELGAMGSAEAQYIFLGYQAPAGKTITRIQASRTAGVGGVYVTVDDLSFVTTAVPEPATLSLLALSGLMMLRRRHA